MTAPRSRPSSTTGSDAERQTADAAAESGDIGAARRVLNLEAEALGVLARSLGKSFVTAIGILSAVTGRVVVSGMGKSGHIGRKLAATMASTGTPAMFVHPAEASHGDLGMIAPGDAVLVLSNSGKTPEVSDIVAYAKRFAIPLIAVVGPHGTADNPGCFLAEAADVVLALPATPEACPMGLTPTTSTTAMLALGDALAIALLQRKVFSAADFQVLHPGGRLGQSSVLKVADLMHVGAAMPIVATDTVMSQALLTMTEKSFGCVGVVSGDGALVGIVTDGDLRRHMGPGLLDQTAAEVMTPSARAIRPQALAAEALGKMNANAITSLFVTEGAAPVGIIHIHDCLRAGIA